MKRNNNSILLVRYDDDRNAFTFDFKRDNINYTIKLENVCRDIVQFENCYYYGYVLSEDIDVEVRAEFIKTINYPDFFNDKKDVDFFVSKAVGGMDFHVSLPKYNVVVYPESMSELNRKMLSYLSRITEVEYIKQEDIVEGCIGETVLKSIVNSNIIVLDDMSRSDTMIYDLLNMLRRFNGMNYIVVVSLYGGRFVLQ